MPNYTRPQIPGSSWFFTVNLLDRKSDLLIANIAELRDAMQKVKQRHPFHIDAIRDETDYQRHVEYCYINPVKHGHVGRVVDWPYSSFQRDVKAGIFPADWAGDWNMDEEYGER